MPTFFAQILCQIVQPEKVEHWIEVGGPLMMFALLFSCSMGFPVPEDIPLLIGGFFVAKGKMNIVLMSIAAWVGIVGGDLLLYRFGYTYGLNMSKMPLIGRHLTRERILKAERLFDRWGTWVVAIGRFLPGVRGAVMVAAGAIRFNFYKFIITDGLVALVSGGAFVALGYYLGRKLDDVGDIVDRVKPYEHYIIAGFAVLVLVFVIYLWWRYKRHKTVSDVALDKVVDFAEHHSQPHGLNPHENVKPDEVRE